MPLSREAVATWKFLSVVTWRYPADHRTSGPLLLGKRENGRLVGQTLWRVWRDAWVASGLRPGERPPPLKATRKTYAWRLQRSGAHSRTIQHLLGHAKLESTEYYLPMRYDELAQAVEHAQAVIAAGEVG